MRYNLIHNLYRRYLIQDTLSSKETPWCNTIQKAVYSVFSDPLVTRYDTPILLSFDDLETFIFDYPELFI